MEVTLFEMQVTFLMKAILAFVLRSRPFCFAIRPKVPIIRGRPSRPAPLLQQIYEFFRPKANSVKNDGAPGLRGKDGIFGDEGVAPGHAERYDADAHVCGLRQGLAAGEQGRVGGDYVVYEQDVPAGCRGSVDETESPLHVAPPLGVCLFRLGLGVSDAFHEVRPYRQARHLGEAGGQLFALVVAAAALLVAVERDGNDHVYAFEKVRIPQFMCHGPAEVEAYARAVAILEPSDDAAAVGARNVADERIGPHDGHFLPEETLHHVAPFAAEAREGQVHVARRAEMPLAVGQPPAADCAAAWKNGGKQSVCHRSYLERQAPQCLIVHSGRYRRLSAPSGKITLGLKPSASSGVMAAKHMMMTSSPT